jgi:hypothetical protein
LLPKGFRKIFLGPKGFREAQKVEIRGENFKIEIKEKWLVILWI